MFNLRKLATESTKPLTNFARTPSCPNFSTSRLIHASTQSATARIDSSLSDSNLRSVHNNNIGSLRNLHTYDKNSARNSYAHLLEIAQRGQHDLAEIQERELTLQEIFSKQDLELLNQFSQLINRPVHLTNAATGNRIGNISKVRCIEEERLPVKLLLHRNIEQHANMETSDTSVPRPKEDFIITIGEQDLKDGGYLEDIYQIYGRFLEKNRTKST